MSSILEQLWWLPTALAVSLVGLMKLRQRNHAVGIAGWALPIAGGLMIGLWMVAYEFADPIAVAAEATAANRMKITALVISQNLAQIRAGLMAAVVAGALVPWMLPRGERRGKPQWQMELSIVATVFLAACAGWLSLNDHADVFAGKYYFGAALLLALASLSVARLRSSSASIEHMITAVSALGTSIFAWLVLARVEASAWIWHAIAYGTPENRQRTLYGVWRSRDLLDAWPTAACVIALFFGAIVVRAILPRSHRVDPKRAGWQRRGLIASALVVAMVAPHAWLWSVHREATTYAAQERAIKLNPFVHDNDLSLASSHAVLSPEDIPTIRIGRSKTLVSAHSDMRSNPLPVANATQWDSVLQTVVDERQREAELLAQTYDPRAMLVVDRCRDSGEALTALQAANRVGISRFKLLTSNEASGNRVFNAIAPPPELPTHLKLTLSSAGIDVFWKGERVEPLANCAEQGPTVCSSSSGPDQLCNEARQDYSRLAQVLRGLKAQAPREMMVIVVVRQDVPWQSTITLFDTVSSKNPGAPGDRLFPDIAITL